MAAAVDAEVDRIRNARSTLVHGDYSPKNVLVDGKSLVEYVRSEWTKDQLRALAKRILERDRMTLREFVDALRSVVDPT